MHKTHTLTGLFERIDHLLAEPLPIWRSGTASPARAVSIPLSSERDAEILADLSGKVVDDLGVTGNGGAAVLDRIPPP
jgi:hypothetical protein